MQKLALSDLAHRARNRTKEFNKDVSMSSGATSVILVQLYF